MKDTQKADTNFTRYWILDSFSFLCNTITHKWPSCNWSQANNIQYTRLRGNYDNVALLVWLVSETLFFTFHEPYPNQYCVLTQFDSQKAIYTTTLGYYKTIPTSLLNLKSWAMAITHWEIWNSSLQSCMMKLAKQWDELWRKGRPYS